MYRETLFTIRLTVIPVIQTVLINLIERNTNNSLNTIHFFYVETILQKQGLFKMNKKIMDGQTDKVSYRADVR